MCGYRLGNGSCHGATGSGIERCNWCTVSFCQHQVAECDTNKLLFSTAFASTHLHPHLRRSREPSLPLAPSQTSSPSTPNPLQTPQTQNKPKPVTTASSPSPGSNLSTSSLSPHRLTAPMAPLLLTQFLPCKRSISAP